jgi:hypothetical protein
MIKVLVQLGCAIFGCLTGANSIIRFIGTKCRHPGFTCNDFLLTDQAQTIFLMRVLYDTTHQSGLVEGK